MKQQTSLQRKTVAISNSGLTAKQQSELDEEAEKEALLANFLMQVSLIANRDIKPELSKLYWVRIKGFSLRQIRKGLDNYLITENRWPWPSDLVAYIEEEI